MKQLVFPVLEFRERKQRAESPKQTNNNNKHLCNDGKIPNFGRATLTGEPATQPRPRVLGHSEEAAAWLPVECTPREAAGDSQGEHQDAVPGFGLSLAQPRLLRASGEQPVDVRTRS